MRSKAGRKDSGQISGRGPGGATSYDSTRQEEKPGYENHCMKFFCYLEGTTASWKVSERGRTCVY